MILCYLGARVCISISLTIFVIHKSHQIRPNGEMFWDSKEPNYHAKWKSVTRVLVSYSTVRRIDVLHSFALEYSSSEPQVDPSLSVEVMALLGLDFKESPYVFWTTVRDILIGVLQ